MSPLREILVYAPIDVEPRPAIDQAIDLARRDGARITLLSVLEPVPAFLRRLLPASLDPSTVIEEHLGERLAKLSEVPAADGLPVQTAVAHGRAHEEIIRAVLREGHDLVIKPAMGDEHSSGVLGPTARHLLRKCPCPVLVVTPDTQPLRHVVAAVAPPESDDAAASAHQSEILSTARAFAKRHGAALTIIHAWDVAGADLLRRRLSNDEFSRLVERSHAAAQERLRPLVENSGTPLEGERIVMPRGPHGRVIAEYLRVHDPDLVVMGTLSRSGIAGLLIGNTAERVLETLPCSVLAVKPPGFVSPITLERPSAAA